MSWSRSRRARADRRVGGPVSEIAIVVVGIVAILCVLVVFAFVARPREFRRARGARRDTETPGRHGCRPPDENDTVALQGRGNRLSPSGRATDGRSRAAGRSLVTMWSAWSHHPHVLSDREARPRCRGLDLGEKRRRHRRVPANELRLLADAGHGSVPFVEHAQRPRLGRVARWPQHDGPLAERREPDAAAVRLQRYEREPERGLVASETASAAGSPDARRSVARCVRRWHATARSAAPRLHRW